MALLPLFRSREREAALEHRVYALQTALAQCKGNQTRAAAVLGYSLRKLVYLMTRYELPRPRKRKEAP